MAATNIGNLVTGQFAQAQSYASSAQAQVASFLSTLNTAAAYTVPTINVTWAGVDAPAAVAPPSSVTLDDVGYTAPTPDPGELTIDPVVIPPMTFGESAPASSFPTAPTLDIGTTPTIPAVGAVAMPSAPTVTMPDTPTLLSLSIPTFAGVDLHEDWLTKFDNIPTLALVQPTPYSYSVGPEYASTLLTALQQVISRGTGTAAQIGRPAAGLRIIAVEGLYFSAHLFHKTVVHTFMHQHVIGRNTDLARIHALDPGNFGGGMVEVRAFVHDDGALSAQFEGHGSQVGGSGPHDDLSHGRAPRKKYMMKRQRR